MKLTKRLLALVLIVATLSAFLVPSASADNITDERIKAVVATAKAFHFKENMQYDSTDITVFPRVSGGVIREHNMVAPEEATADHTVYTVCSSFCWEVYYNALGFKITPDHVKFITEQVYNNSPEGMVAYRHENKNGGVDEAVEEAKKLVQPGDICIICSSNDGGHAMLYVGDIDGDGTGDIIHSTGGKYDMSTGKDSLEPGGNIVLQPATDLIFSRTSAVGFYRAARWVIIRPSMSERFNAEAKVTDAARSRIKYDSMAIYRTVNVGFFGSAETGENLTYTVAIKNNSTEAYNGLNVKETVPEGTSFVSATEGGTASGSAISWNSLTVAPGETKTLTYTVKITAPRGTVIVNKGGLVDQIPSNTLTTTVIGKKVDASKLTALKPADVSGINTEFANNVYAKAFGAGLNLPTSRDIQKGLFEMKAMGGQRLYELKDKVDPAMQTVRDMLVPTWLGGYRVNTVEARDRNLEPRPQDLQPGDIIIQAGLTASDDNTVTYVWDGARLLYFNGKKTVEGGEKELTALLSKDFYICLRPALAYDDVMALPMQVKLPFTDVKQGDWYYDFVSELYGKKIVSGMTATTFVPNGQLTYGQALKLVVVGLGNPEQASVGGNWASGYLAFAKNKGWMTADADLNAPISRLAFCQIAAKAKNLTAQPASNPFKDCADKDVLALVNAGIINGMSADTFSPNTTLTRAQISKIISGLIK